jgi:hypothetical protein
LRPQAGPATAHAAGHGQENQAMPVYKVFTWNIQRAQSVSRQGAMIRERYRVLKPSSIGRISASSPSQEGISATI